MFFIVSPYFNKFAKNPQNSDGVMKNYWKAQLGNPYISFLF